MIPADLNPLDLTDRLGLPMEATPAQIAPLLGGEHDADARMLIRAMIRRHQLQAEQASATARREYDKAIAYADARFEVACSYAALLETP
jgi:hypothetical protein